MKVVTVVGTRPEVIRMALTIRRLDAYTNHVLVHTGQNFDFELSEVFFRELGLRRPDYFLGSSSGSLGTVLGRVLCGIENVLNVEKPDAFVVLGDTNSAFTSLIARRSRIPVYHLEAGNRSFDENVPEEVNRRAIDHIADYNLVYTEHARTNLISEGLHPSKIILTGSPLKELLSLLEPSISKSGILSELEVKPQKFVLVSTHREENVDNPKRLQSLLEGVRRVGSFYRVPVLMSTHPRTRLRLEQLESNSTTGIAFHKPFGFFDYMRLQSEALIVLSDSGTISEEASIMGFPAVSLRDAIERPESIDSGSIITAGVDPDSVLDAARMTVESFALEGPPAPPPEYLLERFSRTVVACIRSTASTHHARTNLRRIDTASEEPRK